MGFRSGLGFLFVAGVTAGCGGGERTIVDPPPPGSKNPTITLVPHSEDAALANQLGWSTGVPGAEATLTPADGQGAVQTFTSSAAGSVTLPQLTEGKKYLLSVRRILTAQEVAKLGTGSDVLGFAGYDTISVNSATAALDFILAASRRGSLVISEWSFTVKYAVGLGDYSGGVYLEVYNNSDSTIYLDGIVFGSGFVLANDYPPYPCSMFEALRTDPSAIWSLFHYAFPGNRRDTPLAPGKVAVVAVGAIDHSAFWPGLQDLRGADFELALGTNADNPTVPNMVDLSVESPPFGQMFGSLGAVAFLATPGPMSDMPRRQDPRSSRLWRGFPADRILDAFATGSTYDTGYPLCPRMLHERFERRHGFLAPLSTADNLTSSSRKIFSSSGGSFRLQDTRTSAADFRATPRNPGQIQ